MARIFRISTGPSRLSTRLKRRKASWAKLATKLQEYQQIDHTYEQYMAFDRERQAQLKDVGYYIGGWFKGSKRLQSEMTRRSLITLDADHLDSWDIDAVIDAYKDYEFVAHSTMKHSSDTPRLRIVFPLNQDIKTNQYEPAARALAHWLGMDCYDDTTFQPARIMFWPAVTSDGEIWKHHNEGELVNPEMLLEMYDDWQDFGEWPHSKRVDKLRPAAREAEDPLTKPGIIGAFNRTYDIHAAIARFELPYETTDFDNRYRPFDATGPSGAVVYDDVFLYSHHESDVVGHQNVNAWDLVRIHKFADQDANTDEDETPMMKRPSSKQMMALAMNIPEVAYELRYGELSDLDGEARPSATPTPTKANPSKDETEKPDLTYKSLLGEIEGINVEATDLHEVLDFMLPRIAAARLAPHEVGILAGTLKEKYPKPAPTKGDLLGSIKEFHKQLIAGTPEGGIADIEQELIQAVLDEHFEGGKTLRRVAKRYWTYERGLWALVEDERIKGHTIETMSRLRVERPDDELALVAAVGESKTSSLSKALNDMLSGILAKRVQRDDPLGLMRTYPLPIINCLNCELHFNYKGKMKRKQHNPENFYTIRVGTEYDPDAECPEWDRFNEIVWAESSDPEDMQRHLEELGGYVIQMSRWLKTWVLFHGPKDTGKSTVAEVLKLMLGSAFLGQDFSKFETKGSTFAEQNLIGKLAIIDDDYSRSASLPDGFIKKVSEEKSMTIDIKFGTSVQAVTRALPMILANHYPRTKDISDALNERALVFPFHHRIAGSDKDDARRAKMFKELPGIMVRFAAGVRRLRKRGDWLIPLDCRDAHNVWLRHANTLNAFRHECVTEEPGEQIEPKLLHAAYKQWIKDNETAPGSIRALGRPELYARLDEMLGNRVPIGGHLEAWKGWRLHDPRFDDVEIIPDSEWDDADDE